MRHYSHDSNVCAFLFFHSFCVPQFKEAISAKFSGAPVENLCLIFAGKIMKDQETLASHNVKVNNSQGMLDNILISGWDDGSPGD